MVVAVAMASLVVAASCASDDPGKDVRGKSGLVASDPATIPVTVRSVNAFGADLYRAYRNENRGNFVLSPYVLAYVLSMSRAGAAGDTLKQLDQVLHVAPGADIDRGFATLAQVLATRNGERRSDTRKGKIDIQAASSEWAPRGTKFKDTYLETLSSNYGVGVRVVDFRSDPETARTAMNNWVRDATRGTVTQLVPRGLLTDQTSLIDASTFTLQASWDRPFQPESTTPARFTTDDGQVTMPRTMSTSARTGGQYGRGDGWQAVELPYLGNQLSMVLVLPDAGTWEAFDKGFGAEQVRAITEGLHPSPIDVRLPKFQFETSARLDSELHGMGMPAAFDFHDADFGAIAENENLSLSAVAHQSYIDVSENGTGTQTGSIAVSKEDAAVGPSTMLVTFDRPFVIMVRDRETGLLLSVGRVVSPNG